MNDIYLIHWNDAESIDDWTELSQIDHEAALIKSIGWLINENKKTVTLALNHDTKNGSYSCLIKIPKGMISLKRKVSLPKN